MANSEEIISWLTAAQEASIATAETLRADSRGDEAALEQVRGNVYRTFGAMFQVVARVSEDGASAKLLFEQRAEPYVKKWEETRKKAEANGDTQTAVIERIKLDTLTEIRVRVEAIGRGEL